jgi:hypothetical protein
MPVDFSRSSIPIPVGTVGRFNDELSVSFDTPVLRAAVMIQGFQVEYDDDVARRLSKLEVSADMRPFDEGVDTDVRYQIFVELVDRTEGESFNGFVSVVVIAEVA